MHQPDLLQIFITPLEREWIFNYLIQDLLPPPFIKKLDLEKAALTNTFQILKDD
jgi:hypothetical protein